MNRMLSLALALTAALFCATLVQASSGKAAAKPATMTLTGCLEKGGDPNTFKLTHVAEKASATKKMAEAVKPDWELIGAPAALKMADHVGHKVTITGTKVGTSTAMKIEGEKGAMAKASEAMERHIKVTAMKHVAPTCP